VSAVRPDKRGFYEKDRASRDHLETAGRTFLAGYGWAAEATRPAGAEDHLDVVPRQYRGFAYQGAAMAFALRDGLPFGAHDNVARFLAGHGRDHAYMVYIGIGLAMARLPRFRWPDAGSLDPLLQWLVLDGYGFHQAYFHTRKYVDEQYRPALAGWPAGAETWYADHAVDQGIGRALWFVAGTDAQTAADLIDRFPSERRPDLYGGLALGATYAGGAGEQELERFWERAGAYRSDLAPGSAFGAAARLRAGLVTDETRIATEIFCGVSPEEAAQICADTRPTADADGQPAYEVWRQRIANRFVLLGRC
jgi:enediyne biosynthesis protein E3